MNSIDVKPNAIFKYQNIHTLFRFIQICLFLILISTFSLQFPSIRISTHQFKQISFTCFTFTPKFVFVIGNVIILILLFKSPLAENEDQIERNDVYYDEYVKRCQKNVENGAIFRVQSEKIMEVKCNDQSDRKLTPEISRSQSEKMMMVVGCKDGESGRKLRRLVTEGVEGLSSEAFRRTVEEFIARQQQSLRDQELAPVPYVVA